MNTCIVGHRGVRDGVIHTGAVALMLGVALAVSAPPVRALTPGTGNEAQTSPKSAERSREGDQAVREREREAARERAEADQRMREAEERLNDAQERMNRAAAEVAAIAAERASEAMESMQFMDGMAPSRGPVIGVDLDPESRGGALVRDVSPGGPAEEAGIRAGDVIVRVNGKDMQSDGRPGGASRKVVQELQAFRGKLGKNGDAKLKVQVLRDGKPKDFEVVPRRIANAFVYAPPLADGGRPPSGAFNLNFNFATSSDLVGLEVTTLTPQLGKYFGASKGVLVVRAPKRDTYKLQDGDVILAIDGREPVSGSHITRILNSYQPGEQVTLRVLRDHKTQDLQITVPDRRQSHWGGPTTWIGEPM